MNPKLKSRLLTRLPDKPAARCPRTPPLQFQAYTKKRVAPPTLFSARRICDFLTKDPHLTPEQIWHLCHAEGLSIARNTTANTFTASLLRMAMAGVVPWSLLTQQRNGLLTDIDSPYELWTTASVAPYLAARLSGVRVRGFQSMLRVSLTALHQAKSAGVKHLIILTAFSPRGIFWARELDRTMQRYSFDLPYTRVGLSYHQVESLKIKASPNEIVSKEWADKYRWAYDPAGADPDLLVEQVLAHAVAHGLLNPPDASGETAGDR